MEHNVTLNAIQLAVAPVFLLTAVATLIGALAGRLGRIIDRAREVEDRIRAQTIADEAAGYAELRRARLRGWIVNAALGFLTISAVLIGGTVVSLFVGETAAPRTEVVIPWTFLGGVGSFILALLCFLAETVLAMSVLDFGKQR